MPRHGSTVGESDGDRDRDRDGDGDGKGKGRKGVSALSFLTLKTPAFAETEEKKSRFLGYLVPIADFEARLAQLRAEHPKANHHVTAFRLIHPNNQIEEGAKDDGEPSGTSGMPILKLLIGRNLIDVGAIVVRYFGGTKLGTGGLARAYPGAVKAALEQADLIAWSRSKRAVLTAPFAKASELEALVSAAPVTVVDRRFTEQGAVIEVEGPEGAVDVLAASAPG